MRVKILRSVKHDDQLYDVGAVVDENDVPESVLRAWLQGATPRARLMKPQSKKSSDQDAGGNSQ